TKYAQTVQSAAPQTKTVVVLVTDGEPGFLISGTFQAGCDSNDIDHVVAAAKASYEQHSIPVYVIGVGPQLDKLNQVAAAGGTAQAMMISVSNPDQTKLDFQAALNTIRKSTISCNYGFPEAPEGTMLDVGAVNVLYTPGTGDRT